MILKEKELSMKNDLIQKYSYQCSLCGRKEVIRFNEDRALCTHCGHYIYKNELLKHKYEFKDNLRKAMRNSESRV